jgi:two-component system sensor histidine kinase KdpD
MDHWRTINAVRHRIVRAAVGVLASVAVGAVMLPIRHHLAIATAALVLVIPVVAGVALGGWSTGLASVIAGFVVYDFAFIPPYWTLRVGSAQHWVTLFVYGVVMVIVARLVTRLRDAQTATASRAEAASHLLDLSELLLADGPALAERFVAAVQSSFQIGGVALVQSVDGHLEIVASAGTPMSADEFARLRPEARLPVPLNTRSNAQDIQTLAIATMDHPIGLLALRNAPNTQAVREALLMLANQLAIALEHQQLQERAHRAEILEEIDHLRQALVGAVSHDLRTPLATIKVASSTLVERGYMNLPRADLEELFSLIDQQADRLDRLVSNLLDMTRIQTGALELRRKACRVDELVADALAGLHSALGDREIRLEVPSFAPSVDADPTLIVQVLVNLLDNANRHAPPGTPITVEVAAPPGGRVTIAVMDEGTGVPKEERTAIFETFVRFDTGGRSGLGLAIAKAFVEAHGDQIWVEDGPRGGARFVFTLPVSSEENGALHR